MGENRFIVLLTDTQDIKVMECDPQEDILDIAKRVIDCDWIQDVYPAALGDDYLLLVDDEGKYREGTLTINSVASDLIGPDRYNDPIIGNAVIVKEKDESLTLLTRGEAVGIANMLTLKRDLTPNEIANAYRAQQSALHTNNPARDTAVEQHAETEVPVKVKVPCNVEIKRYYRTYVLVDEGATEEQIAQAMRDEILEYQDNVLTPDPDMDIETDDITLISPDYDAMWIEKERDEIGALHESAQADTKPPKKKGPDYER